MITEYEYTKALKVIDAYENQQKNIKKDKSLADFYELLIKTEIYLKNEYKPLGVRATNCLKHIDLNNINLKEFMKLKNGFLYYRNGGKKSWEVLKKMYNELYEN